MKTQRKLSICCYIISRMQDKIMTYKWQTESLNMWHRSYLTMTIINTNLIQEENKRKLNYDIACYQSVQKMFFSSTVKTLKN
jgi:hypothetical protein